MAIKYFSGPLNIFRQLVISKKIIWTYLYQNYSKLPPPPGNWMVAPYNIISILAIGKTKSRDRKKNILQK